MGTTWSVRLYAEGRTGDAALCAGIQERLDEVTAQMSGWAPQSDLCRFGRAPPGAWQALPEPFLTVMRCALKVAEASGGAFDPTVGRLVDLWGFGPSGRRSGPPAPEAIEAALAGCGWDRLEIDGDGRLLQPGGIALDLSGVAKGFAVDHVAAFLEGAGVRSYLVEVGGEFRGRGAKGDGSPWWVELEQPSEASGLPATVAALAGLSVAASGDYRRFFEHAGVRHAHTLDPRTGRPSRALAAVSVLHPSCMVADAMATAIGVLGMEAGAALAERRGLAAWLVERTADGFRERLSPALRGMLN